MKYVIFFLVKSNHYLGGLIDIKSCCIESGNKYLFSVPYTPKTNVIEMVFNQIKHYLKLNKKVLKYPELKREVGKAISKIKPMNYN